MKRRLLIASLLILVVVFAQVKPGMCWVKWFEASESQLPITWTILPSSDSYYFYDQQMMARWNLYCDLFNAYVGLPISFGNGNYDQVGGLDDAGFNSYFGETTGFGGSAGKTGCKFYWDIWCFCTRSSECDIAYNSTLYWVDDPDGGWDNPLIQGTLIHELGHSIGLNHNLNDMSVMNYFQNNTFDAHVMPDDVAYLYAQFPNRSKNVTDMGIWAWTPTPGTPQSFDAAMVTPVFDVKAGDTITIDGLYIGNLSKNQQNGVIIKCFLSGDKTIDESDYYIGNYFMGSFPPASGGTYNGFEFTIPTNVPPGYYYVGFIIYANGISEDPISYNNKCYLQGNFPQILIQDNQAPTPNPMTWAVPPYAVSSTSIAMTATQANDPSLPISYYFDFINSPTGGTGGADLGWQPGIGYTNVGLQPNHQYGYQVMARDGVGDPTSPSSPVVYVYTLANSPGVGSFSDITQNCIRANWTANGNPSGTEYWCEDSLGNSSDWTTSLQWQNCGLQCGQQYAFQVRARNGENIPTDWVILGNRSTLPCPDTTAPSAPIGLAATPNGWTNSNSFSINWTNPSDPSGIAGAWYKFGSPPTSPTDGQPTSGPPFSVSATIQGGQPIYVWLEDGVGNKDYNNCNSVTLHYDATPPANGTILINNGDETITNLIVTLNNLSATETMSGLSQMHFSNNSTGPWSPWEGYASVKSNWDLSQYGGNANPGLKSVYVEYQDAVGNVSTTSYSDTIQYQTQTLGFIGDLNQNIPATTAAVAWADYDHDGNLDLAVIGTRSNGTVRVAEIYHNTNMIFALDGNQVLTPVASEMNKGGIVWTDFNGDGLPDLAYSGWTGIDWVSKVYGNTNGILTEDLSQNLLGVTGNIASGDYDNDGDLDLALIGYRAGSRYTKIYRNENEVLLEDTNQSLPGVSAGCIVWGDYDGDGDLDLALCGTTGSGGITKVYKNEDEVLTEDTSQSLAGMSQCTLAWVDYDNDGDLDLVSLGNVAIGGRNWSFRIYRNENGILAEDLSQRIEGLEESTFAYGDYNNDGTYDFVLTGWFDGLSNVAPIRFYKNIAGQLVLDTDQPPIYINGSSIDFGDYDNDGDLDLVVSGYPDSVKILKNNISIVNPNLKPNAPSSDSLAVQVAGSEVTLSWGEGSDDITSLNLLTYNLRIGTTPGGHDIVTGVIPPGPGNVGHTLSHTIKNLGLGTYYWSVQTVDTGFAKSDWASERTFTTDMIPPTGMIIINNGDEYTNSTSVTLYVYSPDPDVYQMRFSNGPSWSDWETYQGGYKAWNLEPGGGLKGVVVQFMDFAGNPSEEYWDEIILDDDLPIGSVEINGGAACTTNPNVTLTVSTSDSGSYVILMRFSNDGISWSDWEYVWDVSMEKAWTLTAGSGIKTAYVQLQDGVGNPSEIFSDTILLTKTVMDFDGDNKSDVSVWRPGDGYWYIINSNDGSILSQQWGAGTLGDIPVPGDYDGDGITDVAVWRPGDGYWYIINSKDGSITSTQWGSSALNDVLVPGDYDGDGKTDIAVWRPGNGFWYIISSKDGSIISEQWGAGYPPYNDKPVPGDYDGDGVTDYAVWRPGDGFWYILKSSDGGVIQTQWGSSALNDVLVPGDYDGDGKTDIAVWRPGEGYWYIIGSKDGSIISQQWGAGYAPYNDVPVPGDYDGDGKTDFAVWRLMDGFWYILKSSDGGVISQQWGWGLDPINDEPISQKLNW